MSSVANNVNVSEGSRKVLPLLHNARGIAKWSIPVAAVVAIGLAAWAQGWLQGGSLGSGPELLTYTVEARDLPITVIERGNLESQKNVEVFCEVDDVRNDGIHGTPIVWIIPNGSSVSEGDLICEFDSTAIQTELDEQILDTEEARSSFLQAEANMESQKIQNITSKDKAKLDLDLAKLELQMFKDPENGSQKLAVEEINRQIDDVNNDIMAAEMNLRLRLNEKIGIENLFKLGYAGKSEKDRSELSYLQAEGDYAAQLNKLKTQVATLDKLKSYDREMKLKELQGKVRTAEQNLKQVEITNVAKMEQMKGVLSARKEQLQKEEERLKRYREQLAKCKVYAPQDGMIAYTSKRDVEIREGIAIRPRQQILSIPNLRKMQVETAVHESVLDRIQPGLKATITVDAFPDRSFQGTIESVAVLPERSWYSDTKTYETIITIDEEVYSLKPGMTAVCEIHIDYLPDVKAVPIQAIVQRESNNWVYVEDGGIARKQPVSLGPSNDQFVALTDGIELGDRVVLNPGALIESADDSMSSEPNSEESSKDSNQSPAKEGQGDKLVAAQSTAASTVN